VWIEISPRLAITAENVVTLDMHPKKWTTIEMNLETRNQNAGQITE